MATGDFVQGAYGEGLTGAIATLGATPTPGNTVAIFESVRQGGSSPAAPTGFTRSPAGTTLAFETAITAWSRIVALGDGTSYDTGSRPGPTLIWVEEREGALAFDASSNGAPSADPNSDSHFVGPTITPTAGYVGAVYGLFGWKGGGGVATGTPDSPWTEVADHDFSVQGFYLEKIDGTTSGSYTSGLTKVGLVFDSHSYAAQTLALTTAPPTPPPPPTPDPGPVLTVDGVELTTAYDVKFRVEHNNTGSAEFKINRHSPEATTEVIQPQKYATIAVPQINDDDPIFSFILETGDFTLISSDEEGGEVLQFAGRGSLAALERAIWLSESFLQKWWPQYKEDEAGPPGPNDIGALALSGDPGTYYHYTVNTTTKTVTSKALFHTDAVTAYYDKRILFTRADGSQITLVHFSDTVYAGYWVHPYGAGVKDYPKKSVYASGPSILMSSVSSQAVPGEVLYLMYQEAIAADRPVHPLAGITIDFNQTTDSRGDVWTETTALEGISVDLGEDYLTTLGKLIGTGVIDVVMTPDLVLHAYNSGMGGVAGAYARPLTGTSYGPDVILFRRAENIADTLHRIFADAPVGTFAEAIGSEDSAIGRALLADPGDRPDREISVHGDTTDTDALAALAAAELSRRLLHSDTEAFAVDTPIPGREDVDTGQYLPGPSWSLRGNYWIGDVVTLDTGSGLGDFSNVDSLVAGITLEWDDALNLKPAVELGSGYGGIPNLGSGDSTTPTGGGGTGAPTTVTLTESFQLLNEKDQPSGYPSLDEDGLINYTELPTRWKQPVRVATTAPVTLATGFEPGDTIDGVTLAEGDDLLIKDQSTGSQNGLYTVAASGTPLRRGDFNQDIEVLGAVVLVLEGTANGGKAFRLTNTTQPTIDTDALAFAEFGSGSGTAIDATDGSTTVSDPDTVEITGSGGIAVSVSESPSGTAAFVVDGSGVSGSGGGLPAGKLPVQSKTQNDSSNTNSLALTLGSTPTNGNLLILVSARDDNGTISSITETNVTWTQVATSTAAPRVEVWKGVVSASASTSITVAYSTSSFSQYVVTEWNGITGTLDTSAITSGSTTLSSRPRTPPILPGQTDALVIGGTTTTSNGTAYPETVTSIGNLRMPDCAATNTMRMVCVFGFPGQTYAQAWANTTNSSTQSGVLVSLT